MPAAADLDTEMVVPAPAEIDERMVVHADTGGQPQLMSPPLVAPIVPGPGQELSPIPYGSLPPEERRCYPSRRNPVEPIWECAMPVTGDSIEWDFLSLVTLWNLYGLPVLLVAAAVVIGLRFRPAAPGLLDGFRTVRLISLIHYGLALRGLIQLVQELLTMRAMGVPESFANLITWTIAVLVNPLLGLGLWQRRPRARRWAIAWYVLLSVIAIIVTVWLQRYHVAIDPARWPDHLVGKGLPLFLLGVMLLPRIITAEPVPQRVLETDPGNRERMAASTPPPPARTGWTIVSLLSLLLFFVVISTMLVDVADWTDRLIVDSE